MASEKLVERTLVCTIYFVLSYARYGVQELVDVLELWSSRYRSRL
jgi:hypothetical protein